jgi:DNA polymerase (family 10)
MGDDVGPAPSATAVSLSNAEIAHCLISLAQLLSTQKENPYKTKAYQRAAAQIHNLSASLDEMVRDDADLTRFASVGEAIAGAIREIVMSGTLATLEKLRGQASPIIVGLSSHPRLDPKRVMRVYKKLNISSIEELRRRLDNGDIPKLFGANGAAYRAGPHGNARHDAPLGG